jgi:hypothetical protein
MKTIPIILFLFISSIVRSQTCDILFVPQQNSLVGTIKTISPLGLYLGGHYMTTLPNPYTYTTPFSFLNRFGVFLGTNKISFMVGIFSEFYATDLKIRPDAWIKINPFRLILNNDRGFDLSLGVNYSKGINYGVGVSYTY